MTTIPQGIRYAIFTIFAIVFIYIFRLPTQAIYDPRSVPNNQFGIHVVDFSDIDSVEQLVNSNGGSWGYIKFVITEGERNTGKWNTVFREMRRRKLIPIVRIATRMGDNGWEKPTEDSMNDWPVFLNSLSWPVQNRYVILFNEPNHAGEWGREIDPIDFAKKSVYLAKKLKDASNDYFLLPAGLDVSAQNDGKSMRVDEFLRIIHANVPEYFDVFDGWNSHSYPNPAFSAPPTGSGRGSLRSFEWELQFLRSLGVTKDYPILIGETGWAHRDGIAKTPHLLSTETVASYIRIAGETVWRDRRIFAIIPFLFNYQQQPFDIFSWKKQQEQAFHAHYFAYQALPKTAGEPIQREQYTIRNNPFPEKLIAGSLYPFHIDIINEGQAIISSKDGHKLKLSDSSQQFEFSAESLPILEPEQSTRQFISLRTPDTHGTYTLILQMQSPKKTIDIKTFTIMVIPPPSLRIEAQLGWRKTSIASEAAVLIYDGNTLLHEFKQLHLQNGKIVTPGILNIIPHRSYRIVTLIPYYLPRQAIQPIDDPVTVVKNKRFYPFDFNANQRFDLDDIATALKEKPATVLPRFIGR